MVGYRDLIKVHKEQKEVTKVVNGEQKKGELSPFVPHPIGRYGVWRKA